MHVRDAHVYVDINILDRDASPFGMFLARQRLDIGLEKPVALPERANMVPVGSEFDGNPLTNACAHGRPSHAGTGSLHSWHRMMNSYKTLMGSHRNCGLAEPVD